MYKAVWLSMVVALSGCSSTMTRQSEAVDLALKTCGMGVNTQSAFLFKAAYDIAEKKAGADFGLTMNNSIDTQTGALLKQIASGSEPGVTSAVLAEVGRTRECVIQQASALRPVSRLDLLEQCRAVLHNRISPKEGNIQYATIRNWNPLSSGKGYKSEVPIMSAYVDTGGTSSEWIRVRCDISGGVLRDVEIVGE